MAAYLLLIAIVLFICILLSKVSSRLGVPMLFAFILLGMFFGSDGAVKIPFENYAFAEKICSAALIFIMFYGGFGTNWRQARPVAAQAVLLSTLGVLCTAGLTGVFCHAVLGIGWLESFLIGAVISSTDAASVFSILRSKKLNLKYNTASLLEVESGSNDPCAYMLTAIFIAANQGTAKAGTLAYMVFAQVVYGLVFGAVIAAAAVWLLKRLRFAAAGFDMIFVVGMALLAYAAPALLGGNGYLSVYIVGLALGNADIRNKKNLIHFFDGLTGLTQILIFFLLGLLAFPSRLPQVALPALLIALFITVVARPLTVSAILLPFHSKPSQQAIVSLAGLRGASSIVFAIMVKMSVDTDNDIFHMIFLIVLFSILLQGSLLPLASRKTGMLDANADVMKTFNDYTEEVPVQFIQFALPAGHPWCGKELQQICLPPQTLVVLLVRAGERIVPNGQTVLMAEDKLILSAGAPDEVDELKLFELPLKEDSPYVGKKLSQVPRTADSLVIMIQRAGEIIIPHGDVELCADDVLVIHHTDEAQRGEMKYAGTARIDV